MARGLGGRGGWDGAGIGEGHVLFVGFPCFQKKESSNYGVINQGLTWKGEIRETSGNISVVCWLDGDDASTSTP